MVHESFTFYTINLSSVFKEIIKGNSVQNDKKHPENTTNTNKHSNHEAV